MKTVQELYKSQCEPSLSENVIGVKGVGHCSFMSEKYSHQTPRLQNSSH